MFFYLNKIYDVQNNQVQETPNTNLAMKLIRCSDAVVMNCLIDHCKLETILLVEDQELAIHLTAEEENVPRNLTRILLTQPSTDYYPAPMYRTYSSEQRPVRYLQVNMEQRKT